MPGKLLVIRNIPRESLGLLEQILANKGINYDLIDASDQTIYPEPSQYSGVIVLGGPDSANDKTPKMVKELEFVRRVVEQKVPYLGICLGMQVLVAARGGTVYSGIKEIGCCDNTGEPYSVELTLAGSHDPLFHEIAENYTGDPFSIKLKIFQLHGETVTLLENYGMQCLAAGEYAKNQIVKVGDNAYGIQGHFELDDKMFENWLAADDDLRRLDPAKVRAQFEKVRQEYHDNAKLIFGNWLKIAGF